MGLLKTFASSPSALLGCLIAGGFAGWLALAAGAFALVLGQVYLALVNLGSVDVAKSRILSF